LEIRNLGKSGLGVSAVGLGCNNFGGRLDQDATSKVVHAALDHGITLFDTADIYGNRGQSEVTLGVALGARRKDIVLATKSGKPMDDAHTLMGNSRRYMISAVEASLKRLKTDWIDLHQLHDPDPKTPIEETLRALDDLIRAGKIRYIGISNFAAWEVAEAEWAARALGTNAFISSQDEYSMLVRDNEKSLFPLLEKYEIGLLPYFPLASGALTGKYKLGVPPPAGTRLHTPTPFSSKFKNDETFRKADALEAFAKSRGHTLLELAFSWLADRPMVASVIAGATKPEQIAANAKAINWELTDEDREEVDRLTL
jgi:aryl-alcohol dehydrogenase-like predicted oxidoreductase